MVDIKKPQEFNIVIPEKRTTNRECPFVFFPINIIGCNHPLNRKGGDYQECSPSICPLTQQQEGGKGIKPKEK